MRTRKKKQQMIFSSIQIMKILEPVTQTGIEGERLNVRRNINLAIYTENSDPQWKFELAQRLVKI
jgi:hypothetical protein